MKLLKTKIDGPKIIKTTIFKDSRGFLKEVYRKNIVGNIISGIIGNTFRYLRYNLRNIILKVSHLITS